MSRFCLTFLLSCFCCQSLPTCPWVATSTCTKIAYELLFLICLILLCLATHLPWVTKNLPFCKGDDSLLCRNYSSFPAIYRISFAFALFFFVMCICTVGISSSRSSRSVIHNGFWFQKIALIIILLIGTAYIPHGLFDTVLMYFALVFMVFFNLYEMYVYIRVLKALSFICRIYCTEQSSGCGKFIATLLAMLLQSSGVAIFVILIIIYCNCTINLVFTIVNMCLSYLISLGSFFAKLRKKDWDSILSGTILTTHVMVLTWSAITNNEQSNCNPTYDIASSFFEVNNIILTCSTIITILLATQMLRPLRENPNSVVYVEERGKEICGIWGKRKVREIIQPEHPTSPQEGITYRSTDPNDDEYNQTKYTWSSMHNLIMLAIFSLLLCFTKTYMYNRTPSERIFENETAMWFKIASSWLCMLNFLVIEFLPDSTSLN